MTSDLANLVYHEEEIQAKYPQGKFFEKSRCFLAVIDRITYIVYRGTEISSISDVLADLNAKKVHPFGKGNGLIHGGFFQRSRYNFGISIDAKEDKVDEGSILDLIGKSESERVIFTGHSLGGASAELSFLRYITFCENFPSNPASRFKDKSSYIVYAAPINTSIEIRKKFEKYTNQMHSIDQYNDPIVEIVRDAERIFRLHKSDKPAEKDHISLCSWLCPTLTKSGDNNKVALLSESAVEELVDEDDDYNDSDDVGDVKMIGIITEEYYKEIRGMDLNKSEENNKGPYGTSLCQISVIPIFDPVSVAMGIHHIEMKDNNLHSSSDYIEISKIFSEFHTVLDLNNHKMVEYKKFVNNILNKYEEYTKK